jgi:hypothetical protein
MIFACSGAGPVTFAGPGAGPMVFAGAGADAGGFAGPDAGPMVFAGSGIGLAAFAGAGPRADPVSFAGSVAGVWVFVGSGEDAVGFEGAETGAVAFAGSGAEPMTFAGLGDTAAFSGFGADPEVSGTSGGGRSGSGSMCPCFADSSRACILVARRVPSDALVGVRRFLGRAFGFGRISPPPEAPCWLPDSGVGSGPFPVSDDSSGPGSCSGVSCFSGESSEAKPVADDTYLNKTFKTTGL